MKRALLVIISVFIIAAIALTLFGILYVRFEEGNFLAEHDAGTLAALGETDFPGR